MNTSCQLLVTGRSFSTLRKAPRKFKVLEQGFLPDFRTAGIESRAPGDRPATRETPPPASPPRPTRNAPASPVPFLQAFGTVRTLFATHLLGRRPLPKQRRPACQGELSLAAVQVKRNDLIDADIEVHATRAPAGDRHRVSRPRLWQRWANWWSDVRQPTLIGPLHR